MAKSGQQPAKAQTGTAAVAQKGDLATLLANAAKAAPAAQKTPRSPRAVFTVTQLGAARMSGTGKTVLVAVTGETEEGAKIGGTLWIKP